MLPELQALFRAVAGDAEPAAYEAAVVAENVLAKPTTSSRRKTFAFLRDRYGLDPGQPLFAALRILWDHDAAAQPLLALLAALARDPILQATAPLVIGTAEGTAVRWEQLAAEIDRVEPGKLAFTTLRSTAQNTAASWTQSGHLAGRRNKTRARADARPTSAALALLLGHLCGERGDALFATPWVRILDAPAYRCRELAAEASRQGWIDYRHAGAVTEVGFSHLLPAAGAAR
jgi:hypothetical protein